MTTGGRSSPGPLDGLRVLDLTRNVAGPSCTMVLGDMGADVIKIERPGQGDDTRQWMPPGWNGESAMFLSLNRNKRSLAVDLDTDEGREIVVALANRADVLVETFRPGSLRKRGLDYEDLKDANPGLIYCSISAYGRVGPMHEAAGYDPVVSARAGIMSLTGHPGGPPTRLGISALDLGASLWATIGVLSALVSRRETGKGCRVDTSLYETAAWLLSYHIVGYLGSGVVPQRSGTAVAFIAPYETFSTADEDLFIAAANDNLFRALVGVLGIDNLASDPRFAVNPQRVLNRVELHQLIEARLKERSARDWESRLLDASIPCSRIQTIADLVSDPQFLAVEMLSNLPHALIPDLQVLELPMSQDGKRTNHRLAPPAIGGQTGEILREMGYGDERIESLRQMGVVG